MTLQIIPLGAKKGRDGKSFEAFGITHEPTAGNAWPTGPVFPEGHFILTRDCRSYEVVTSRTVEVGQSSDRVRYIHTYVCRLADPKDRF